jgi:hypothetical protein
LTPNDLVSLRECPFSFAVFAFLFLLAGLLLHSVIPCATASIAGFGISGRAGHEERRAGRAAIRSESAVREAVAVSVRVGKWKDRVMQEDYDPEKCAALVKEGREITDLLKAETESIRRQMARALEGGEDEPLDALEATRGASTVEEGAAGKSFWQFWR